MQNKVCKLISEQSCVILITLSVIPGFILLGNLFAQVVASAFSCLVILLLFDLVFKLKPLVFAKSLSIMTVFWVIVALIKQIILQLNSDGTDFNWFHLFYYDRPAMLFIVQFVCIIYFVVKLIIKKSDKSFINDYGKFIKHATICFVLYYLLILIYCFIIVREITFIKPIPNLIPFDTIINSFSTERIDYELLFLFLGNIAIFLPLGVFSSALIKNKIILMTFPVVLSVGIEVSQYYLGNGHPDIDDVLLNVMGFYIGILFKSFVDFILSKASKGTIKSFFIFS